MCLGHERLCVCGKTCDPRLEPIACVQSHAAPTYIRSELNPVTKVPHAWREGKGSKGDGTHLDPRRVSAMPGNGHASTLELASPPGV